MGEVSQLVEELEARVEALEAEVALLRPTKKPIYETEAAILIMKLADTSPNDVLRLETLIRRAKFLRHG